MKQGKSQWLPPGSSPACLQNEINMILDKTEIQKSGVIPGGDPEYFAFDAVSRSRLLAWMKSPMHFFEHESPKETKAMRLGSAFHLAISDKSEFDKRYVRFEKPVPGSNMNKSENKQAWNEIEESGALPMMPNDYDMLGGMIESIKNHPTVSHILSQVGVSEQGLFWTHECGIKCKIKPDFHFISSKSGRVVPVDFKTCTDASEAGFIRACRDYALEFQDGFYSKGLEALYPGREIGDFLFVMIEKTPTGKGTYPIGIYKIEGWQRDDVQTYINFSLCEIAKWKEEKRELFGYADPKQGHKGIVTVELPNYVTNKYNLI